MRNTAKKISALLTAVMVLQSVFPGLSINAGEYVPEENIFEEVQEDLQDEGLPALSEENDSVWPFDDDGAGLTDEDDTILFEDLLTDEDGILGGDDEAADILAFSEDFAEETPAHAAESGSCGDNLTYVLGDDGVLTISGTGALRDYPAWDMNLRITTVILPEGLTSFGAAAFYACANITSIDIPANVTNIGSFAFSQTGITTIAIPAGVTAIGEGAFDSTGLTDVYYEGTAEEWANITIGTRNEPLLNANLHFKDGNGGNEEEIVASGKCGNNVSWSLNGAGVLRISGSGAMQDWEDPTTVPWENLYGDIKSIVIEQGITRIGSYAFIYLYQPTSVVIPEGVAEIGNSAFYNCSGLENVQLPQSLETIEPNAFGECYKLREVMIPAAVTTIEYGNFTSCTSLTNIQVAEDSAAFASADGVLFNKEKTILLVCPAGKTGTYSIPSTVTMIGGDAFTGGNLSEINIPASVSEIEWGPFTSSKASMINVDAGNANYSSADGVLFDKSKSILYCWPAGKAGSFNVPESVETIFHYAFCGCKDLTSVYLGTGIREIGWAAFSGCDNLTDVYYSGTQQAWNEIQIDDVNEPLSESQIHYEYNANPGNETASGSLSYGVVWEVNGDTLTLKGSSESLSEATNYYPDEYRTDTYTVTTKEDGSLEVTGEVPLPWKNYVSQIRHVVVDDKIENVWSCAFYGMQNLETVTLQAARMGLRAGAFANTGLKHLYAASNTRFYNCSGLAFFNTPLTEENDYYLQNGFLIAYRLGLTNFAPPAGTEYVTGDLCAGDPNLETITLPEGFKQLSGAGWTFKDCNNLKVVYLPGSCTATPDFYGCKALHTIVMPEGITNIGGQTAYGCSSLRRIVIPSTVTKVAREAFYFAGGEGGLAIYFKGNAPSTFNADAFSRNRTFDIYYPAGNSSWETFKAGFTPTDASTVINWHTWNGSSLNLASAQVAVTPSSFTYNGEKHVPENISVTLGGKQVLPYDYRISYVSSGNQTGAEDNIQVRITPVWDFLYSGTGTGYYTINKADAGLAFAQNEVVRSINDPGFNVGISKVSDGSVSFTSSDSTVASIDAAGNVTLHKAGKITITASVPATGNYLGGSAVMSLTVKASELDSTSLTWGFVNHWDGFNYPYDYRIPLKTYQRMFGITALADTLFLKHKTWGGNCYGMSSSSGLLNVPGNGIEYTDFNASARKLSQLSISDRDAKTGLTVTELIECMHVSQYDTSTRSWINAHADQLDEIAEKVSRVPETGEPVMLCLYGTCTTSGGGEGRGGHAILAYALEQVDSATARMKVYDCNYPGKERYIMLAGSNGHYTAWSYQQSSSRVWGTSDFRGAISYVPYSLYKKDWDNQGELSTLINLMSFNSANVEIMDVEQNVIATVEDGILSTDRSDIFQLTELGVPASGVVASNDVMIYLPSNRVYAVRNNDVSTDQFEVSMTNVDLSATVTTDADSLYMCVNDDERKSEVSIDTVEGQNFSIELKSTAEADSYETMSIVGTGQSSSQPVEVSVTNGEMSMNLDEDDVELTILGKGNNEKPHEHSWDKGKVTRRPTAVQEGVRTYTCSGCKETKTEEIKKLPATISLNAASIKLKTKQKTTAVKVGSLAEGDYVRSVTGTNGIKGSFANGVLTIKAGKKTGRGKVTITLASGKQASVTVKVQKKKVEVKSIKGVPKKRNMKRGERFLLQPVLSPITAPDKITFTSSNKKVATVDKKGNVKAKKAGKVTITVKAGKKKATCKITVK